MGIERVGRMDYWTCGGLYRRVKMGRVGRLGRGWTKDLERWELRG